MNLLVAFFLLLTAQNPAPDTATAQIRAARERSNHAIVTRDIKTFSESLSPDFVMVRGSGIFVGSREEYIALFRNDFADPKSIVYTRTPDEIEVSTAAPLAAEHGHWIGRDATGADAYGGTYLAMWRHTESGWQIRSELFVVLTCAKENAACRAYTRSAK